MVLIVSVNHILTYLKSLLTPPRPEAVQQYIELNPVRANMVNEPAHYRWSSYRANGLVQTDLLLMPHDVYFNLGQSEVERMEAYRALFRSELDADAIGGIRCALNQGQPLGNSNFLDSIERITGVRREPKSRGRPRKLLAESNGAED